MAFLTRKSLVEREQERATKLRREFAAAQEQEHLAVDDHTAKVRRLEQLPELNAARLAGGLDLLPVAPLEAEVAEAASVLNARARHRGNVERQLRDATRDLTAAIDAERRERHHNAVKKMRATLKTLIEDVTDARNIQPDDYLGTAWLLEMLINFRGRCDSYVSAPVAPAVQAAPVRLLTADDLDRCQACRHKQSNHWASGRCDGCSCRSYTAPTPAAPPAKLVVVRFKESFRGGTVDDVRQLAAMTVGEIASYEPRVVNWLCDELKVAERVVVAAPVPDQAA